jgi:hypothetical protein
VKEYYDVIHVVYIHSENCYGSVEKLGAYASLVRYSKHGQDFEELLENDDFTILDEIVHQHVEE